MQAPLPLVRCSLLPKRIISSTTCTAMLALSDVVLESSGDVPCPSDALVRRGTGWHGDIHYFTKWLNEGGSVGRRCPLGETALHWACATGEVEIAKLLLAHGANPRARAADRNTPLHEACWNNQAAVVEMLLRHDRTLHGDDNQYGRSALHLAASQGHVEVIQTLLQNSAELRINHQDERGMTPLMRAIRWDRPCVVPTLLEHGAFADIRSPVSGKTAVDLAGMYSEESLRLLEHYFARRIMILLLCWGTLPTELAQHIVSFCE